MEGNNVKDMILADAIKTAIESEKRCEKLKMMIYFMALVMVGMMFLMIGG